MPLPVRCDKIKGMALRKKGKYRYGDSQQDIRDELRGYSRGVYLAEHFADAVCFCGGTTFVLLLDGNEGVAKRVCAACQNEHFIGDSEDYAEDAELEECQCPCGAESFEITAGIALYEGSDDVKWIYLGCRCVACALVACYGDWKSEYENYRELLARV